MTLYAVQYQFGRWEKTRWEFLGICDDEQAAMRLCEQYLTSNSGWHEAEAWQPRGCHISGTKHSYQMSFNVMPVELNNILEFVNTPTGGG